LFLSLVVVVIGVHLDVFGYGEVLGDGRGGERVLLGPATGVSEDRDNEAMLGVSADVGGAGEANGLACDPNRVGAPKREFPSDWTSVESYTDPSVKRA
jgi:hypothetical protein